jgi:hypothetical protein
VSKKVPFDYDGDGKPNTEKDKKLADQDLNNDGYINKADETLRQDRVSMQLLGRDYNFAFKILSSNPEIQALFEDAVKLNQTPQAFEASVKGTKWYQEIGGEYARKAWFSKTMGGADWDDQMVQARDIIQRTATQLGANLNPDDIDTFAERYLFEGWNVQGRQGLMQSALASKVESDRGGQIQTRDQLAQVARDNGVSVSDQWFNEAAQSIAMGRSTAADYEMWLRDQAAAKHPLYADKIRQGMSVKSLASPYTMRMAEILELNPESIDLSDPYLTQALGEVDEKGNPKAMSYTDFENKLRNDPRWEQTTNGKNTLMNTAQKMARDWGFVK